MTLFSVRGQRKRSAHHALQQHQQQLQRLSFIELSTEKSPSPNGEPDVPMLIKTSSSASLNRRMVVGAPNAYHFCVPRAERRSMISTTISEQLPALYAAQICRSRQSEHHTLYRNAAKITPANPRPRIG